MAIAYVLQKTPYVFPIIGGRKVEHLHANIEALSISLSPDQISYLEGILPFDVGFPANRFVCATPSLLDIPLNSAILQGDGSDYNALYKSAGYFDKWPVGEAIRPIQK